MGNSEVGHQNIGAGRIVDQESVTHHQANPRRRVFRQRRAERSGRQCAGKRAEHCICSASSATRACTGCLEHLFGCLELCKRRGLTRVFLHAFTDGRDTLARTTASDISAQIEAKMKEIGVGQSRHRQRAILGDGPGQPLAARGESVSRHHRRRRARNSTPPRTRSRTITIIPPSRT